MESSSTSGQEIDIGGIEEYILNIQRLGYRIGMVTYDSFQSANSLQVLEKNGILAQRKSVDRSAEAYHTLKDLISQSRVQGYYDKDAIIELLSIDLLPNNKIAKRPGLLKDRADAIAGAVHNAIIMAGTHTMKQIHDVNDVFGDMEEEGTFDAQTGNIIPKTNKQGFIVHGEICIACRAINCLEYSGITGRVINDEEAISMWCMACNSRWTKMDNGGWLQTVEKSISVMI